MTIEINQLKIISEVNGQNSHSSGKDDAYINAEEKEEIIEECLNRLKNYLEQLGEA